MENEHEQGKGLTRREFLSAGIVSGAAIILTQNLPAATTQKVKKTDVWVFHGKDKKKLINACLKVISDNGGFGKGAKKLTLKVNAAWYRTPEQGANTHPELVDAFLIGCKKMGIKEVVMPEHSCDDPRKSFPRSGLLQVAQKNGAKMYSLGGNRKLYKEVKIPKGKRLKKALVGKDFLETDALVNIPVAKHHGSARLSIAMKNWMGAVRDRGYWHRNNLHQCIADFSTFIKPTWTIIDATRIMLDRGPKGPARNLKHPNLIILSRDQVAADAYASTLFPGVGPTKVGYLKIAREMKIGTTEVSKMAVHKIEVS
ncbi:MAG: DUF362 domain-containing protein [Planctomycetes bacterium]|nr:DUF362 domain-containing protein [Planctomycetota bacterium]